MRFVAYLNITLWQTRRTGAQMASDRVRRDKAAVKLFQALKHIHPAESSTLKGTMTLWGMIEEAVLPTGRIMRRDWE